MNVRDALEMRAPCLYPSQTLLQPSIIQKTHLSEIGIYVRTSIKMIILISMHRYSSVIFCYVMM